MGDYSPARDKVTLFGLSYCPYSKGARIYLSRRGVDFVYVEVDCLCGSEKQAVSDFLAGLTPAGAMPVTLVGATGPVSIGYDPKKLQAVLPLMPLKRREEKAPAPAKGRSPAALLSAARGAVEKGRHPSVLFKAAKGAVFKARPKRREFR